MKKRMSITVDPKTERLLETLVKKRKFRNKSHAAEELIRISAKGVLKDGK